MKFTLKVPAILPKATENVRRQNSPCDLYSVKHEIELDEVSMSDTLPVFDDEPKRVRYHDGKFFEAISEETAPFQVRVRMRELTQRKPEANLSDIILFANNAGDMHAGILIKLFEKCREKIRAGALAGDYVHTISGLNQTSEDFYSRLQTSVLKTRTKQYKNLTEIQKENFDKWIEQLRPTLDSYIRIEGDIYKQVHAPKLRLSFALSQFGNSYSVSLAESGGFYRYLDSFIMNDYALYDEVYTAHIPVGDKDAEEALKSHIARRFGIEFDRSYMHVNFTPFAIEGYKQNIEISEMRWLCLLAGSYLQSQFIENIGRPSVSMTRSECDLMREDVSKARAVREKLREAQKSTDPTTLLAALTDGVDMIDRVIDAYCIPKFKGDLTIEAVEQQGKMIAAQCERFTLEPIPLHTFQM